MSKTLVDDLADVLSHMVVGWKDRLGVDLAEHPEVQRVMERYRTSKIPCEAVIFHGPGHQSKTRCEHGSDPHSEHHAHIMGDEVEWSFMVASLDYDGYTAHERVYCDEGDGCHSLREPNSKRLCSGYMHPRNRK